MSKFNINTHEFDIAFSFPGEHRAYVRDVVDALSDKINKDKIFYDEFYKAWLAVPSSDTVLQDIYRSRSKLIVLFLCEKYQEKEWCGLEARAIRDLIKVRKHNSIMPIKVDDGEVDGFFGIDGWIDARTHKPEEIADFISQRLTGELPFPASVASVEDVCAEFKHSKLPANNLSPQNKHFTGRKNILGKISSILRQSSRVTIVGTGGYGKTQIAIKYAYDHAAEYDYIWLINAESKLTLEQSYREFALRSGMPPTGAEDSEYVLQYVKSWLEENSRYLFIYDNAEGLSSNLQEFLPVGQTSGHILINTREKWADLPGDSLDVELFSEPEAVAFLQKCIESISDDDAKNLSNMLGYLPLALGHAAAYMAQTRSTCTRYMQLLEREGLKLLSKQVATIDPQKTVAVTWLVSMEQIQSESARQLFNLCAYFEADNIPLSMFIEGRSELPKLLGDKLVPGDELAHDDILLELERFSLLSFRRDSGGNAFMSIHRLIQAVVREKLAGDTQWLSYCLDMAHNVFDYKYGDKQSMDAFAQNVPHILQIAGHAEKAFCDDNETQEKIAWLYHTAGFGFIKSAQYPEALEWFKKASTIYEKVLGKEHPDTATTYNNIGGVYDRQGDYPRALEWYEKALAVSEKVLGKEHPDTLKTCDNIAGIYDSQGYYPKALEWYEEALAICEIVLGKEHPITATTYNNIAGVYDSQGDYPKALELYEKALAICEIVLGKEHPNTATTYNNIAEVHSHQGNYLVALEWYKKDLTLSEKFLGKKHTDTASIYNNIALVYSRQGDYPKALEWHEKALDIREKVLGKEHPSTAISYNNVAQVYSRQGDYSKALKWYQKSYVVLLYKLGDEHPDTKAVEANMEIAYHSAGFAGPFEKWLQDTFGLSSDSEDCTV